jgi:hypothetical protein
MSCPISVEPDGFCEFTGTTKVALSDNYNWENVMSPPTQPTYGGKAREVARISKAPFTPLSPLYHAGLAMLAHTLS